MTTDLKMHDEPKAAWCALLQDPTICQVTGKLYGERTTTDVARSGINPAITTVERYGYCCLGVLAKSQGATFEFQTVTEEDEDGNEIEVIEEDATVELPTRPGRDLNDNELLDGYFAESVGLTTQHQTFLSALNDGGEVLVAKDSLFFPLYQKYCESEGSPRVVEDASKRLFMMRKHSFAEIRNVILEEF